MRSQEFRRLAVLLLTALVTAVFIGMIWQFLIALFLAAVFSGLVYPVYSWLVFRLRGRKNAAAALTLAALVLIVLLPTLGLLNLIGLQAYQLSEELVPWLQQQVHRPDFQHLQPPDWLPFKAQFIAVRPQITEKLGEFAGNIGGLLVGGLSSATKGTAGFFLDLFVMLYAMLYFLKEGVAIRGTILLFTPLARDAQERLLDKGISVTRATLKGTLIIGIIQGLLGGLGLATVGIQSAAFWGAVMAVASIIPSIGTALVWVPAVAYLVFTGETLPGVGLALWCVMVVGSVDNLLRPVLVGGDTQMPDILILISTFGGLAMFGLPGLIIGPVIAALCVTMWDVYYLTFQDVLNGRDIDGD